MKKIDLNIKIDDFEPKEQFKDKTGFDISKEYIELAFVLHQNEPNPQTGRAVGLALPEQRKIYKILDCLDAAEKGIVEFEDDMYEFLKQIFNQVKWVGGTKIVVRIADKLDKEIKDEKG